MKLLAFVLVALFSIWLLQALVARKAKRSALGRETSALLPLFPTLAEPGSALVFAHSPGCTPCKNMQPIVQELADQGQRVYQLDTSRNPEAAQALGIRVIPTTLLVDNLRVRQLLIGYQSKSALQLLLDEGAASEEVE